MQQTSTKSSRWQSQKSNAKLIKAKEHLRVVRRPLLLSGVQPGKLITITPEMYDRVDVDRRYQRDKITASINDMVYVLQNGGDIPDPITVVKRGYSEADGRTSNKLWIIDGQQRFMAHMEVNAPIQAMVHEVESLNAEKAFFIVMNSRTGCAANITVNSWPGPSADLLRMVERIPSHSLFNRIQLTRSGDKKIGAAILIRGMCYAMGSGAQGKIEHILNKADSLIGASRNRQRAEAFLSLCGQVFVSGYAPMLAITCLGSVASERWEQKIETPSAGIIKRLHHINWNAEVPSFAARFRPVMEATIRKVWR